MSAAGAIVLVGPGRAGVSVARALCDAGYAVAGVAGGSEASYAAAVEELGPAPRLALDEALPSGATVIVAVPDDRLAAVAAALSGPAPKATFVLHLSGATGRDVLAPVLARGARTAAWHPLRAFATRASGRGGFAGAAVAIEAASTDFAAASALAVAAGGRPFALAGARRALYHAAAALAGNAPLALLDAAERAFAAAGAPPDLARSALLGLMRGALDNAERLGPAAALTGPVVRGDADTVARHLAAFGELSAAERTLYAELARALTRLAAARPDGARADAVRALLASLAGSGA